MDDVCNIGFHKNCGGLLEVLVEIDTFIFSVMCDRCLCEWDNPVHAINDLHGYRKSYDRKISRNATVDEAMSFGFAEYLC